MRCCESTEIIIRCNVRHTFPENLRLGFRPLGGGPSLGGGPVGFGLLSLSSSLFFDKVINARMISQYALKYYAVKVTNVII